MHNYMYMFQNTGTNGNALHTVRAMFIIHVLRRQLSSTPRYHSPKTFNFSIMV